MFSHYQTFLSGVWTFHHFFLALCHYVMEHLITISLFSLGHVDVRVVVIYLSQIELVICLVSNRALDDRVLFSIGASSLDMSSEKYCNMQILTL